MLTDFSRLADFAPHDVCIVGAGPVGLATALACEELGLRVLLLESGKASPDAHAAGLSAGHNVDLLRHAAPQVAIYRGLGGASRWWGGRCVPYDDIDFAERSYARTAAWPISHDEVRPFYEAAAEFFGVAPARFAAPPVRTPALQDVQLDPLERWTPQIDMSVRHRVRLEASSRVKVVFGATVTDLKLDEGGRKVKALTVIGHGGATNLSSGAIVLACGGLETPRLLLETQRKHPAAFGGADGSLGRGYMGHVSGKIADLVLADPRFVEDFDFFLDEGVYARRRLQLTTEAQQREGLLNIAFWADNPPFHAAEHCNGVLSLVWAMLAVPCVGQLLASEGVRLAHVGPEPYAWRAHLRNVLRSPWATALGGLEIFRARFLSKPSKPGFLIHNQGGRYALHYHAEQEPNDLSRVILSDRLDATGMPFLDVGLHFTKRDAASVVRSHELLDAALRGCGVGRLEFHQSTRAERLEVVLAQATDGFHQTGATRMAREPSQGVVDADCKVHGIENLWIAGSSVLPTSGQANPTFIAVALGIRLARTLKAKLGSAKGSNVGPITEINLPASKASAGGTIERS